MKSRQIMFESTAATKISTGSRKPHAVRAAPLFRARRPVHPPFGRDVSCVERFSLSVAGALHRRQDQGHRHNTRAARVSSCTRARTAARVGFALRCSRVRAAETTGSLRAGRAFSSAVAPSSSVCAPLEVVQDKSQPTRG
eukprot:6207531-Pleurochrysis_carterae.AAC.1